MSENSAVSPRVAIFPATVKPRQRLHQIEPCCWCDKANTSCCLSAV